MSSIYGSASGANVIYGKNNYGVAFGGGAVADTYPNSLGSGANIDETNCTIDTSEKILGLGSLSLNGISSYADLDGATTDYGFLTQAFSLSMWLYPTDIEQKDMILDNCNADSSNVGIYCRFNVTGDTSKIFLKTVNSGSSILNFQTSSVWTVDEWNFLCITYDGTTCNIYRADPDEAPTLVGSGTGVGFTATPTYLPRIGLIQSGLEMKYYDGLIDDMVLFDNRIISSAEMTSLWNSGSGELVSTVFANGDRSGLKVYYNMDEIDTNVILNNAIPTS